MNYFTQGKSTVQEPRTVKRFCIQFTNIFFMKPVYRYLNWNSDKQGSGYLTWGLSKSYFFIYDNKRTPRLLLGSCWKTHSNIVSLGSVFESIPMFIWTLCIQDYLHQFNDFLDHFGQLLTTVWPKIWLFNKKRI